MGHDKVRLTALAGGAFGALILAGCGAREPVETPPAPPAAGYGETQAPDLLGAPPAESASDEGLLGGPGDLSPVAGPAPVESRADLETWRRPDGTLVTAMAPIANPEAQPRRPARHTPRPAAAPVRRADNAGPTPKPVPRPAVRPAVKAATRPAPGPAPVAKPAIKPVAVAPAPAPLKPVVAARPVAPLASAPVVPAAAAPAKPAAVKPPSPLRRLQAAIAPEATKGAVLASGESLGKGQEGQVTLALPATLGERIKIEAARLGLAKAAQKTSAYADLRGEGYEITPNGRQTAVLKAGEPATFAWRVKPTPAAKGPLKTEFGVALNGTEPAQAFTLGSIAKQVAPIQEAVTARAKALDLSSGSLGRDKTIDVPGLGKTPVRSLLGGALVLLALLILVAISRNASAARSQIERRRKLRARNDSGGALAGAAAAPAVSSAPQADPGPARQEYAPFDAPHAEDQAHGARRGAHGADTPVAQTAPGGPVPAEHKELQPTH